MIFYKFRRPMIGQNCSAVCTNKGGHRDAFLNKRKRCVFRAREACSACRPHATEPRAKRETRSVLYHALVVDSTFDQSENVATAVVSSSMQLLSVGLHRGVWSTK